MNKINRNLFVFAGIILCVYFVFIGHFAVNIPYLDDFAAEQNFLIKFIKSISLGEKIHLLFEQHNEHRLLFLRISVLFVYFVTGKLSYLTYVIIGNILYLGIGVLFINSMKKKELKGVFALFTILILYNGQILNTLNWGMVGLANVGILFLAFMSLYCIVSNNKYLITLGFLFSVLTIFSNGNGMFIIIPALICLLLKKEIKISITYIVITGMSVIFYFTNYTKTTRTDIGLTDIVTNLHHVFLNLCMFIGQSFWIPSLKIISVLVGAFCIVIYLWGIGKKWYKTDLFYYASLTFLYISATAVSVSWIHNEMMAALRYRLYSTPIILITLFLILKHIRFTMQPRYQYSILVLVFLFNLTTIIYIPKEQKILEWKKVSAYNWHHEDGGLAAFSDSTVVPSLKMAEEMGLYQMPQYSLDKYASSIKEVEIDTTTGNNRGIEYKIENIYKKEGYVIIKGWAYLDNKSMNFSKISVDLSNINNYYICSSFSERRYDLNADNIPLDRIEHCGFFVVVDKSKIKEGTYRLGIRIKRAFDSNNYYTTTKKSIRL